MHGQISKAGRGQVRGILVEAAWSASRAPGRSGRLSTDPRAPRFSDCVVATACKLTVLAWHLIQRSGLRVRATQFGHPISRASSSWLPGPVPPRCPSTPGAAYNDKRRRSEERKIAEQAERTYQVFVAHWQPTEPSGTQARIC